MNKSWVQLTEIKACQVILFKALAKLWELWFNFSSRRNTPSEHICLLFSKRHLNFPCHHM